MSASPADPPSTQGGPEKPELLAATVFRGTMERRKRRRKKGRVACDVVIEGTNHGGMLLDVSEEGLSVRTDASPNEGATLLVKIQNPKGPPIDVHAMVWNKRRIRTRDGSGEAFRLGLIIAHAAEDYFRLVEMPCQAPRAAEPASVDPPPVAEPAEPDHCYRVRVGQHSGPRSRTLTVSGDSEEDAGARALADLGADWIVLAVESI